MEVAAKTSSGESDGRASLIRERSGMGASSTVAKSFTILAE
jgi:hypothetical protein